MLNNFIDRIKLSFRKDKELYLSLYEILGFYPHDISYYKMALLHKSIMHRNSKGKPVNNERLEFLGDAFEALVGAIYLDRGYDACMYFMQKRILAQMINIDKVAYKEVNFKSKLIEWSQKNRVKLDFVMLDQQKDKNGSPIFTYQVVLEGVEGGVGKGYSKKESQQVASKTSLEKLRKEPQYIDAVFTAKANRTKMEEEPVENVPNTEVKDDFIISQDADAQNAPVEEKHINVFKEEVFTEKSAETAQETEVQVEMKDEKKESDEFDLSDITAQPKELSREEIIAAAEAAAFGNDE